MKQLRQQGEGAVDDTELNRYAVTPGTGQVFFSPEQLQLISEAAGPGGRVELNAFMQLIVHTLSDDLAEQQANLRAAGLGVYPVGPAVKNLHTCTFCMGTRVEGLPDAQALDSAVAGLPVPFPVRVGFSGCSNNCGEVLVRDIGVVRMEADQYDIFLGGKAGSLSPLLGQKVAEGVAPQHLIPVVTALLDIYRQTAKGRERFWKNVSRVGPELYRNAAQTALQAEGRP